MSAPGYESTSENVVRAVLALVLIAFAGSTFLLGPIGVMASDGCFDGDPRFICTVGGQRTVAFTPLITAPVALVVGLAGLGMSGRKQHDWGLALWAAAMAALVVAWLVVTTITS